MAAKKRNTGLGKGLDALFGELEPVSIIADPDEKAAAKGSDYGKDKDVGGAPRREAKAGTADSKSSFKSTRASKSSGSNHEESFKTMPENKELTGARMENSGDIPEGIIRLSVDEVKPNKMQPRKTFHKEGLEDLANSIKEHGVIQPLIVRPSQEGYEIVAGERRYRAAREAGLKQVPCLVRQLSDRENMLIAIIENMQREDLNPIEEAEGIHAMVTTYSLTQEEVSRGVGKSRPYITNALRLLNLEPPVLEMVREGQLTAGHGRTLLACPSGEKQIALAKRAVKEGLSVRTLETLAQGRSLRPAPRPKVKSPDVVQVEESLKKKYGTKVNLSDNGNKGRLEFEYYSREELERLLELLMED